MQVANGFPLQIILPFIHRFAFRVELSCLKIQIGNRDKSGLALRTMRQVAMEEHDN
jgi:hypothetical protein